MFERDGSLGRRDHVDALLFRPAAEVHFSQLFGARSGKPEGAPDPVGELLRVGHRRR